MSLPNVFSLIFFIAAIIYYIFGLYIFNMNSKSPLHRAFFYCCLSFSIWAFSFCIANSAPDYETCYMWRRMAAIGWGTCFSFQINFILRLTESKLLRNKLTFILIYLPAVINVLVFAVIDSIARGQYILVNTNVGWVNIFSGGFLDWFYKLQYVSFSVWGFILLLGWGLKSKKVDLKRQSVLICTSIFIATVLGTGTEFIINMISETKIPQMAPVIVMAPMSVMLYCIKRYGLFYRRNYSIVARRGEIMSETTRHKLSMYLSWAYVFGAIIHFAIPFFTSREPVSSTVLFSGLLMIIGMMIQVIQSLVNNQKIRNMLTDIIMIATIPIIIFKYIDYSTVYAWIPTVVFIIIAIAYNESHLLNLIVITTITSFVILMIIRPEMTSAVAPVDHITRLLMFGVIFWLAHYIHNIYLDRLSYNEEQIRLQKLVSDVSAMFVTVNSSNVDDIVQNMLNMCVEHFRFECSCLLFLNENRNNVDIIYHAGGDGFKEVGFINQETGKADWNAVKGLMEMGSIWISDADDLADTDPIKDWCKRMQVKTIWLKPLIIDDKVMGFMGLKTSSEKVALRSDHMEVLNILSNLVSNLWFKILMEKEINHKAFYDSLTGLPNRDSFMASLQQAVNIAKRNGRLVGVAFMDIDSFKTVNDTMGHEGGDILLVHMAHRLASSLRTFDIISRFGGDEFLIMISQVSRLADILEEADKIMEAVKRPIRIKNQEFFVTASMGIAVYPIDGDNADELVKNADLAMYASKQKGKNMYSLCSTDMKKDIMQNVELTNELYHALDKNEFMLYYQPQVNSKTGEITGIEALLRWDNQKKGMVPPSKFILMAEKTGLINPIGQWVLRTACRQNKLWHDMGFPKLRIAVNLSIAQFINPNIVRVIKEILDETGLDPGYLELEVTESIAGNGVDYTINKLNELKELGVCITMDDFGTEYSSLSRIKMLPVDRIKIDGQFIHGITKSVKDEGIIKVIIQLGKSLDLEVIAEKVETKEQVEFLQNNDCDYVQGFYYYRPMPAEDIERILSDNARKG